MAMCCARTKATRSECLRPVPRGSMIQLCDIHVRLATVEFADRVGTDEARRVLDLGMRVL